MKQVSPADALGKRIAGIQRTENAVKIVFDDFTFLFLFGRGNFDDRGYIDFDTDFDAAWWEPEEIYAL